MVVEILPCVNCTMRNPDGRQFESGRSSQGQQKLLPEHKESELQSLLVDLDRSLDSVDRIRDRIGGIIGYRERRKGRGKRSKS